MRPSPSRLLNILVPVKRAIDYTVKVRIAPGGKGVDHSPKHSMNPFDEIAVEESLRLRAKHKDGPNKVDKITVVSVGPAKSVETLRTGLALGADDAIHITLPPDAPSSPEPLAVAKLLQAILKREGKTKYDLVLMGKQSIDSDASQTGQILAGLMGWSQGTFASAVDLGEDGKSVKVTREIDGGLETVQGTLPMIVTTDLRLNEPRYASLPGIMKAKKKPLETLKPEDLSVDVTPRLEILGMSEPAPRVGGGKVANVEELVARLKKDGLA